MTNPATSPTPRLLSLDVLRGITIAFMIMVNNGAGNGTWGFMRHAEWNGLTPTDLVFPTFVFVMGASIAFAYEARLARGATRAQLAWHTLRRAVILFLLGIVVNDFPDFELEHLRVLGVLQRIALCYLVVGLFYLWDRRVWTKVAALAVALVGYWILVRWVPVPGAGMPGRDIAFLDPVKNIVNSLDRTLLPGHLYEDYVTHNLREPEGFLSTIPAVGTALLGLLSGLWLRTAKAAKTKTLGLAAAAAACLALGYFWSIWFPINKRMWTSSYVLVAAGYALVALTLTYWAVDQMGWGKGRSKGWTWPWLVLGSNAITAYMFSELLGEALGRIHFASAGHNTDLLTWAQDHFVAPFVNQGWASFFYSVTYLAICFIPVWLLYRKKIFVKV